MGEGRRRRPWRSGRRLAPLLAALLGVSGAAAPVEAQTAAGRPEGLDAEMLRDLDVLNSGDYARDREVGKRLRLLERMRILEALRDLEAQPPPDAPAAESRPGPRVGPERLSPAGPLPKEVR